MQHKIWKIHGFCPGCGEKTGNPWVRYGPFTAHEDCTVWCIVCQDPIEEPKIGQQHTVVAWLGQPAHRDCKRERQEELQ